MVELVISMVVLLVAVGGTLGAISSFVLLGDSSRETTLAYLEAQRVIEELRGENFRQVFVRYNDTPADDSGVSPGADFSVPGLNVRAEDMDGNVGEILFPTAPGIPGVLREDLNAPEFGLPRDLNLDGLQNAATGDYVILPVRVRVEWRGRSGNRFIELQTILRGS